MKEDMQQDKLEQFITNHQEDFNDKVPDSMIWQKISRNLNQQDNTNQLLGWKIAAIIFFAMTLGLLFRDYYIDRPDTDTRNSPSEFVATEAYYNQEIDKKVLLVQVSLSNRPVLEEEFKDDLKELVASYVLLKAEFEHDNNDQVLNAMIINLQAQLNLLNRQLNVINIIKTENEQINI